MTTPVGPYTSVVRAGDLLFVSGQVGIVDGPVAGSLAEGGFGAGHQRKASGCCFTK